MTTLEVLPARIHRDHKTGDRRARYRLYCPALPWLCKEDGCLNVHSKVLIIDDEFVTVGSANLSDRSMNLDTECNLAFEAAGDPHVRAAIVAFRDRLLAEHLGCAAEDVNESMQRHASLHAAIEALGAPDRAHLTPTDPALDPMVDAVTPDHG